MSSSLLPNEIIEDIVLSSLLPNEIIENIFFRIRVKSLSRFKCVCKSWCNFISNPNFIKMHIDHGVENEKFRLMLIREARRPKIYSSVSHYDSSSPIKCYYQAVEIHYPASELALRNLVYIRGSCNGLLLLEIGGIYIWNPSTTECKEIPNSYPYCDPDKYPKWCNFGIDDPFFDTTYGFGYDCTIEDYKVVKVSSHGAYVDDSDDDDNYIGQDELFYFGCLVDVYTLRSNSWKRIPVIFPYRIGHSGVLVNGNLNWIATPWIKGVRASKVVLSFDFANERFIDFSPLEHLGEDIINTVGNLGGCLCIIGDGTQLAYIEVWVMKDYGVRESWTKLFTIAQLSLGRYAYNNLKPIQVFKNGDILLSIKSPNNPALTDRQYALVLYNPEQDNVRTLKIHGKNWFTAHTYVESLVSLNTGTYLMSKNTKAIGERKKKNKKRVQHNFGSS